MTLRSPLVELRGIGPKRTEALAEAGLRTVGDLLHHLPFRYEDRRRRQAIGDLTEEGDVLLRGRLGRLARVRIRRRGLTLVRGVLEDDTGAVEVLWFNRPYLLSQVEEGPEYLLYGRLRRQKGRLQLVNPSCEPAAEAREGGGVVPVYGSTGVLGPTLLRRLVEQSLDRLDPDGVEEPLPEELLQRHRLPTLMESLALLHRPHDDSDAEALNRRETPAHGRMAYGELLELQLELAQLRALQLEEPKRHRYRGAREILAAGLDLLPFSLTGAQTGALDEILADLESPFPMLRLLQGDVGSGKTVVAALALVVALESGLQGAFMAPTELLAEQHFRGLSRLLGDRYGMALVTGSSPDLAATRREIAAGRCRLAVGTHALIQESVEFRALGLAVVDEQHRFGVDQRRRLQSKGDRPDMLVMTATPIPRSLALTVYGDLAYSVIDELPPGRGRVDTRVVPRARRDRVYEGLARSLAEGDQAYVVVPLIEESSSVMAASISALEEDIRGRLEGFTCAVLHGRTEAAARQDLIRRFAGGEIRVLLATTVIEVGLDVPAATVMIIESAERFGLAQLHQLRGRVGRGARPSVCVAIHGEAGDEARRRLETFAVTTDGFRIAEADLELRGPGDLLGRRQAGLPRFRVADILRDRIWLERARRDARELLSPSSGIRAGGLLAEVERRARSRYRSFAGG